jgi:phosphate acetyltransferase
MTRGTTPFAELIAAACEQGTRPRLLLPEGDDPRIREAARRIAELGLAEVIVAADERISDLGVEWLTPAELSRKAGVETSSDDELAVATARLVRTGFADGAVLGARLSSGSVVRAGLKEVALAEGRRRLTGAVWVDASATAGRQLIFVDPVVNIVPDALTLAEGACGAAEVWRSVFGSAPKAAFLSSSTGGSGTDPNEGLMREAAELTTATMPDVEAYGPVQGDVALVASIAELKGGGPIRGDAGVLVFPTLAAANIGVKLAEHVGGARTCTFLTGLDRPYNDISRGCRMEDVIGAAAIAVLQAAVFAPGQAAR